MLAQYANDEEEKAWLIKFSSEDPELQEVYDSIEDHFLEILPKTTPLLLHFLVPQQEPRYSPPHSSTGRLRHSHKTPRPGCHSLALHTSG